MIKNNPDALSPISKAFIKACRNPKPNPHKDPPCKEVDLNVPVSDIEQEIIKIKDLLVAHRDDASAGWSSFVYTEKAMTQLGKMITIKIVDHTNGLRRRSRICLKQSNG